MPSFKTGQFLSERHGHESEHELRRFDECVEHDGHESNVQHEHLRHADHQSEPGVRRQHNGRFDQFAGLQSSHGQHARQLFLHEPIDRLDFIGAKFLRHDDGFRLWLQWKSFNMQPIRLFK